MKMVDPTPLPATDRPTARDPGHFTSLYPGEDIMSLYTSNRQERPFLALVKMFRRIREASDRRLARQLQRRAQWIDEARNAPTVQSWMDDLGR